MNLDAHVYGIGLDAFSNLRRGGSNQAVLVVAFGEHKWYGAVING